MAGHDRWPVSFIEDSGLDSVIVGSIIASASLVWSIVATNALVFISFGVGLALLFLGCELVALAAFLRAQDKMFDNSGPCLETLDDSNKEHSDSEDKVGISDIGFLGETGRLDIQNDVSKARSCDGDKESCLVQMSNSEETNHG